MPIMDDQSGPDVRQHVRLAIKGGDPQEGGNFGCESPFKAASTPSDNRGMLKDGQRAISKPKGFHPEPDHGSY